MVGTQVDHKRFEKTHFLYPPKGYRLMVNNYGTYYWDPIPVKSLRRRYVEFAAITCMVMAVLDAISTWIFLHNQTGVEGNAFVAHWMDRIGVIPTLIIGTALRFFMVIVWLRCDRRFPKVITVLFTLTMIFWTWVVYHNFFDGAIFR